MVLTLHKALSNRAAVAQLVAEADEDILAARSNLRIGDCNCGKTHRIGDLKLIIENDYHEPHGCTGGDYYSEGEWSFLCLNTGYRERLFFNSEYRIPYKDRKDARKNPEAAFKRDYRQAFAEVIQIFSRDEMRKLAKGWFINHFIDKHHKKFGLPVVPEKKV